MKVNKPPEKGNCTVVDVGKRRALVDIIKIHCLGWIDPENKGVDSYSINCKFFKIFIQ